MRASPRLRYATVAVATIMIFQIGASVPVSHVTAASQGAVGDTKVSLARAAPPPIPPSAPSVAALPFAPGVVGRSLFTQTMRNADGSLTTTYALRPLHWLDTVSGQFRDFANTLRAADPADAVAGYGQQNTANGFHLKLGKPADVRAGRPVLRFDVGGASVTAVAVGAQPTSASAVGSRITYADAYPGSICATRSTTSESRKSWSWLNPHPMWRVFRSPST